jgi:hypothetical protein
MKSWDVAKNETAPAAQEHANRDAEQRALQESIPAIPSTKETDEA